MRRDRERLEDVLAAASAIASHLARGGLDDGLVFDAVRVRLIEIGEAVKGIRPALLDDAPGVPWKEIARMRDHLAHRYFDTDHAIVQDVVDNDLGPLLDAVRDRCSNGPARTTTRRDVGLRSRDWHRRPFHRVDPLLRRQQSREGAIEHERDPVTLLKSGLVGASHRGASSVSAERGEEPVVDDRQLLDSESVFLQ